MPGLLFQQWLVWFALVQIVTDHTDDMTTTGGSGLAL
jgi:hypothetical protein